MRSEAGEHRRRPLLAAVTDLPQQGRGAEVPLGTALTSILPSLTFDTSSITFALIQPSLPFTSAFSCIHYCTFTSFEDAPASPASATQTFYIPSLGRRAARPSLHARSPPTQTSSKWRVNIVIVSCMSSWLGTVGGRAVAQNIRLLSSIFGLHTKK